MSETFGRFVLEERIGSGGMGEVHRAYDPQQRRQVAVKRLSPYALQPEEQELLARRLAQEADAMARLAIPNVLPVFESGSIDGRPYIVMPYVHGRDLGQVVAEGPLAPRRAVAILGQVATALDFTHAAGLVHRDVKPSNVLLVEHPGGRDAAYLLDYGIVRALADVTGNGLTHGLIGTFGYIAPERLEGEEKATDGRVDVYALACVFYECLTGQLPYPGLSDAAVLWAHTRAPIPQPSRTDPGLAVFDRVVRRGLAKRPEDRFATAGDLAQAAEEALHSYQTSAARAGLASTTDAPTSPPASEPRAALPPTTDAPGSAPATGRPASRPGDAARPEHGRRGRSWAVVAAVVLAVAAAVLAVVWWPEDRDPATPADAGAAGTSAAGTDPAAGSPSEEAPADPAPAASIDAPVLVGEPVPVNPTPGYVEVAPNGRSAYIANREEGILTVLDTAAGTVSGTIGIAAGPPRYVVFSPDGATAYVVVHDADYTENVVAVVDTGTGVVTNNFPVGKRPYVPAVSPDGRALYVPLHDEGRIQVLDTATGREVASFPVARNPHSIAVSADGSRAYTANHESGVVEVLDLADAGRVVDSITVGTSPHSIALSPDGTRAAVVNFESHDVSVIDTMTGDVVATVPVGTKPQDVTFAPDGRHLYTADVDSDTVTVLETTGNTVTATLEPGDGPTSVSVLPDGNRAVVTNLHDGTVRLVQTSAG